MMRKDFFEPNTKTVSDTIEDLLEQFRAKKTIEVFFRNQLELTMLYLKQKNSFISSSKFVQFNNDKNSIEDDIREKQVKWSFL